MGRLIDQFIEAHREWAVLMGAHEEDLLTWPMVWTGAAWFFPPLDKVNPSSVPALRRRTLTAGDVSGHHSLEQLHAHLESLVGRQHIDEQFLVTGLVNGIEHELEQLSEEYAKGVRSNRKRLEWLESVAADSERRSDFIRRMNEQLESKQSIAEPFDEASLQSMIDQLRRWSTPTLREQRDRRRALDAWRAASNPILDPVNLRQHRNDEAQRYGFPPDLDDQDD